MPLPPSPLLIAGWRTTTPFTRIPGWATAHPANTSCCLNPPPVRFNGVNSTTRLLHYLFFAPLLGFFTGAIRPVSVLLTFDRYTTDDITAFQGRRRGLGG